MKLTKERTLNNNLRESKISAESLTTSFKIIIKNFIISIKNVYLKKIIAEQSWIM